MARLSLVSPLEGWAGPLDEAPDPVFAERMLGDGVLIDPTGDTLYAPAPGEVLTVHEAKHAVSLRCEGGAEILMHVGVDTVALRGQGFTAHVAPGARVAAGDKLLSFDLDLLARRAKSLVTPVIVTNGEAFSIATRAEGRAVRVGEALMALDGKSVAAPRVAAQGPEARRTLTVPLAHGLHARPAARIAECAKRFAAEIAIQAPGRQASAKSPIGVMALALRGGEPITILARGADAEAAAEALAQLIASGMGEATLAAAPSVPPPVKPSRPPITGPRTLRGVMAAPGMAIGCAVRLFSDVAPVNEQGTGPDVETDALAAALAAVRARIATRAETGPEAARAVMRAHLAFIDDPELKAAAERELAAGKSAGAAWKTAIGGFIEALGALGDKRFAERADDLTDIERQVLRALAGEEEAGANLPKGAILVADELLPSQLLRLDPARVGGVCAARGGPTSHVAILCAAMGVPALVAVGEEALSIPNGASAILDADAGEIRLLPDAAALAAAQTALAARHERRSAARAAAGEDARMADGTRIEVFANLGSLDDARAAAANGAEGCGLLRTEFLFLDRAAAPDEDEQARAYQDIADALGGRPLIVRTLDIGADKPAPYLPMPAEDNPALGVRGVRISLARPQLLRAQLRAILRVRPAGQCRILVPMVIDAAELAAVRALLDECRAALNVTQKVELGAMIETPAAAAAADLIAAQADFLSLGTNDLAQYALAMDRTHVELAARLDGLHPAVLRLMAQTAAGARAQGRMLGVCGGLAADLVAAPILIGLGATELSATPALVPELKALVRKLDKGRCEALASDALRQPTAEAVRALARAFQENLP